MSGSDKPHSPFFSHYRRQRNTILSQDLSSHLRGVLATQAVLEGMGVGRAGSTPLAATLQWMARDGEGRREEGSERNRERHGERESWEDIYNFEVYREREK